MFNLNLMEILTTVPANYDTVPLYKLNLTSFSAAIVKPLLHCISLQRKFLFIFMDGSRIFIEIYAQNKIYPHMKCRFQHG